jgi:hypothetical protein
MREDPRIGLSVQHGIDIYELNSPPRQLSTIGGFAHIGLSAEHLRSLYYSFFEGPVFESVQRVVMNKDADWALRREQVRSVFNGKTQSVQASGRMLTAIGHLCSPAT